MGWEYKITVGAIPPPVTVEKLYAAFGAKLCNYKYIRDEAGFSIMGTNPKWAEILQVAAMPATAQSGSWLYCLLNLAPCTAPASQEFWDVIQETLAGLGVEYTIEDL